MGGWIAWMIVAQLADVGTTGLALSKGCTEANAAMRMSYPRMVAVKSGATVGFSITLNLTGKRNPKASKIAAGTIAGIGTGAAVWNLSQLSKCGR
jgi:hypothetical protein